jgi:predicted molibdopterin-dependent oxidoreductase YjgC
VWVEVSQHDARRLGIAEGDTVEVSTPRGKIRCAARISGIRDGVLFVPFHYGYFDADGGGHHRAGNELTVTDWDPVSKQPIFKTAAAQLHRRRTGENGGAAAPTTAASAPAAPVSGHGAATVGGPTAIVAEVTAAQGQS